jgi:tetratricopeptide (TPR) repeat protein
MPEALRIGWIAKCLAAPLAGIALLALVSGCGDPPDPLGEAKRLQANLRFQESLTPLRELIDERTEDLEVYLLYGAALIRSGSPSLATWPLRKAMEDPDLTVRATILMATAAVRSGNVQASEEYANLALEIEPDNLEALSIRSMARVQSRRDYEGALADADRILELDPENPAPLIPRATSLLALDRVEEAGDALKALEDKHREDILGAHKAARFCVARSTFSMEQGELEESEEILATCLEDFPASRITVGEALKRYDAAGEPERAVEVLEAALAENPPTKREFRVNLAQRLRMTGHNDESQALLAAAIEEAQDPAHQALHWADLGAHYFETGEHDLAANAAGEAYKLRPKPVEPDIAFDYAEALLLVGRFDEAIEVSQQIEVPAYREFIVARSHLMQGRPAQAIEHFDAGLAHWPDSAVARYYTALAAESLGDFDRAIAEHRYAMRIEPRGTDSRFRLAKILEAQGEFLEAARAVAHGDRTDTADKPSQLHRVRLLAKAGELKGLEQLLSQLLSEPSPVPILAMQAAIAGLRSSNNSKWALSLLDQMDGLDLRQPENAPLLHARIELLGDTGQTGDAVRQAETSLRAEPNNGEFHAFLGLALKQNQAEPEKIRAAYRRAVELDPQNAYAILMLARLAREAGDIDQAMELNARLLSASATDPTALKQRGRLLEVAGRLPEAEEIWEQVLLTSPFDPETIGSVIRLRQLRGQQDSKTAQLRLRLARFAPAQAEKQRAESAGERPKPHLTGAPDANSANQEPPANNPAN